MAGDAHMSLQQGHQGARVCDANLESGTDGGDGTAAGVDNKWARGITLHLELRLPLLQVHPAFARAVALHQHGLRIECEPGTVVQFNGALFTGKRSDARRVGNEGDSTCMSRSSPDPY